VTAAFRGLRRDVETLKGAKAGQEATKKLEEASGLAFPPVCPGYQRRGAPPRTCTEEEAIDPYLEKVETRCERIISALQDQPAEARIPSQGDATVRSFLAQVANLVVDVAPAAAAKLDRARAGLS
jgi:hypothetical protein